MKNKTYYGILKGRDEQKILRKKDLNEKKYLYGCFWKNEMNQDNTYEFIEASNLFGVNLGAFICQYITSAFDEDNGYCSFFKAWVEII